jgi:hypothetical protein
MLIFIAQFEIKSFLYRKKDLEFSVYYIHFFLTFLTLQFQIERHPLKMCVLAEFWINCPARHHWEYGTYISLQWRKLSYSENTEDENMHFISLIILNISFMII